jgi:hypothetical protein
VEFKDWIKLRYLEWRGDAFGRDVSVAKYAEYLGRPQQTVSAWLLGKNIPKDAESVRSLADIYGPEVFDVLNVDPGQWGTSYLPADLRRRLEHAVRETSQALAARRLSADDPLAEQLAIKIFERHGFKYSSTSKDSE